MTSKPWRYDKGFIKAGEPVKTSGGIVETVICSMHGLYGPHIEGNISLITAAPDLLEACEAIASLPHNATNPEADKLMRKVKAAISKATGKA